MNSKRIGLGILAMSVAMGFPALPAVELTAPNSVAAKTAAGKPRIQFQNIEFDFGKVSSGDPVKHSFVFTNTGTATLQLTDVKPGCGCTSSGAWDREVAPGKTGVVPLQFNTAGYGSAVMKTTTVTCNDPDHPTVILTLKGTVWKPIDVIPNMAVFHLPSEGQTNETKVLRIVSHLDDPVTLSDLQSTNKNFRTELKTIRPGKEFELHVTSVPPFSTATSFAPISIKTSSAKMPMINVTAYAMVQQPVVVQPDRFILPAGPLKAAIKPSVTIQNNAAAALTLSEPTANVPGLDVRLQETQPGRTYSLVVAFPEGFQVPSGQNLEVTVKSNNPKFPVIRVPVNQSFGAATPRPVTSALTPRPSLPAGTIKVPAAVPAVVPATPQNQ